MNATYQPLPTTIPGYLAQLREALAGADPALVQDALYDAEEYLRSELAEHPDQSEADVIAAVAGSYGAPEEVAGIYRDTEVKVQTALRAPPPRPRGSALGRFFGVFADPRAYASLFYMLLSLATGVFFFTWVVAGFSVSLGLSITIIGVPLLILFFGSVRVLSLVEGRIVEVMLGERMPRRPQYAQRDQPLLERVKGMFTDPRTWSTMFYMVLMLPLGIIYFTVLITVLSLGLGLALNPLIYPFTGLGLINFDDQVYMAPLWLQPFQVLFGIALLFGLMHLARGVGRLQGAIAKQLLVQAG